MVTRVQVPAEEGISNTPADNAKDMERPQWLPEQFKDGEDLWKSYQELRKDHTKKAQELAELKKAKPSEEWSEGDKPEPKAKKAPQEKSEEPQPESKADEGHDDETQDGPATMEDAKTLLPGFSDDEVAEISNYAWENGELTEEHYAKLEKAGYSKQVVDQFMAGQFAVVEGQRTALINAAGGEKRMGHMFQWASENLSEAQINAYNEKLNVGGADAMLAMESLVQRYERSGVAMGASMIQGANEPAGNTDVFRSTAQVVEAINDPRDKSDPAYRASVQQKIGRSKVL